jgi:hypothetical protein
MSASHASVAGHEVFGMKADVVLPAYPLGAFLPCMPGQGFAQTLKPSKAIVNDGCLLPIGTEFVQRGPNNVN